VCVCVCVADDDVAANVAASFAASSGDIAASIAFASVVDGVDDDDAFILCCYCYC